MKYNVIKNVDRKTITVTLGGTRFFSAKYLLEKYEEKRYFGNAIFEATTDEINAFLLAIAKALNEANPMVKVSPKLFFESDSIDFPLIKRHLNQDGDWDKKSFSMALSSFNEKSKRNFFFKDLARTQPVIVEETIKEHEWGIEIEISSRVDEESLETKTFVIVHRIIMGAKLEKNYMTNDNAWVGFDLGDSEEDSKKSLVVDDEDLPF